MAYGRRRITRRNGWSRSGYGTARRGTRKRSTRRARSGGTNTVKLVIETLPASSVSRNLGAPVIQTPAPKRAKF